MIYLYSTRCNHSKILYFESTHPNSWLSRSFFLAFFFSPTPSIFKASAPLDPIFAFDAARVHKLSSSQTSQTFFFSPKPSMFKASWSHLCFWCSSSQTFCHTNCFGHYCHYWHLTGIALGSYSAAVFDPSAPLDPIFADAAWVHRLSVTIGISREMLSLGSSSLS